MTEFIIMNKLPYLYANGKAYAVRWDDAGFTVGDVVKVGIDPADIIPLSELSVKAKCHDRLDSIGAVSEKETVPAEKPKRKRKTEKG